MSLGHTAPLRTFDYTGFHRYFLTLCTNRRTKLFVSADVVDLVREQILRATCQTGFSISAYCFMPDHLHLLLEGERADADGRRCFALAKQLSGFHYRQRCGSALWQRYGYDHVLRNDQATLSVCRYILENPVRAGLATAVEEYPYVGSMKFPLAAILEAVCAERIGVVRLKPDPHTEPDSY